MHFAHVCVNAHCPKKNQLQAYQRKKADMLQSTVSPSESITATNILVACIVPSCYK